MINQKSPAYRFGSDTLECFRLRASFGVVTHAKFLITGGAGFIGSNLVEHLSATDSYELVILDHLSAGQGPPHLPRGIDFIHGDFTAQSLGCSTARALNAVVHLAALPGVIDSIERPGPSFEINVAGTFQLLDSGNEGEGGIWFINASTGAALLGEVAPPISESMAPGPLSPYGASKLAAEGYCSAFAGAYGLPCVTLRFSTDLMDRDPGTRKA